MNYIISFILHFIYKYINVTNISILIAVIAVWAAISQARSLKMSIRFDTLSKLVERFENENYLEKERRQHWLVIQI